MPPPTIPFVTNRKRLARAQREQIQRRWILAGTALTLTLALGSLVYGWLRETVLLPNQPVAVVNGERILTRVFQGRVRLARVDLLSRAESLLELRSLFGDDPSLGARIQSDLLQIAVQLTQTGSLAQGVLDELIDEALIRQEAARRGIVISPEQVERRIEETFGFFRDGTPTPAPTATLAATAEATPAAAVPAGPTPTAGPTATAAPTPTAYTTEAFQANYQAQLAILADAARITEADYRGRIEAQLYREALQAALAASILEVQELAHARHLLLASEEAAAQARARLLAGETWEDVAAELSLDQATASRGGELGWFPRGVMDEAFEQAAFTQPVGAPGEPVQSSHGWHVIEVVGRETRPLDARWMDSLVRAALADWLADQRAAASIRIESGLADRVPPEPRFDLQRLLGS